MARFDTLDDAEVKELVPSANKLLSINADSLGAVNNLQIGHAIAIWSMRSVSNRDQDKTISEMAEFTGRWLHFIKASTSDDLLGTATSAKDTDTHLLKTVSVTKSPGDAYDTLHAIEFIRNNQPSDEMLARYLILPHYFVKALWLSSEAFPKNELIVVCSSPNEFQFKLNSHYYETSDFVRILTYSDPIAGMPDLDSGSLSR